MKTNRTRRNRETKNSISKLENRKILGDASDRSLENGSDRSRGELELTATKGGDQKEGTTPDRRGHRAAKFASDHLLDANSWARAEALELHGTNPRPRQCRLLNPETPVLDDGQRGLTPRDPGVRHGRGRHRREQLRGAGTRLGRAPRGGHGQGRARRRPRLAVRRTFFSPKFNRARRS